MSDNNEYKINDTLLNNNGIHYMMCSENGGYHNANEYLPVQTLLKVKEVPASHTSNHNVVDPLSSHTVIVSDDGCAQKISCLQCKVTYNSVNEFIVVHNVQLRNDKLIDESEFIEEPLWEVLPNDVQILHFDSNSDNDEEIVGDFSNDPSKIAHSLSEEPSELQQQESTVRFVEQVATDSINIQGQFCCTTCHVNFYDFQTAEQHDCLKRQEVIKPIEAELQMQQRVEPKELIKSNNSFVKYVCEHCGNLFGTYVKFQEHQEKQPLCATGDPSAIKIECGQCGGIFASLNALKTHMRSHNAKQNTKRDLYTCEICNASFRTKRCLHLHGKAHKIRPIRSIEEALTHNMKQDYFQGDQFYCEICDKNFESNLLLVHKNMHLSDEAITIGTTCSICNIEFACKEIYDMHMKLHEGQSIHKLAKAEIKNKDNKKYRFNCQFCESSFKRAYEKVNHERVHTGEKPYACQVCGKRFRTSYSLTMHLRTHTDVRPYECEVCHKCYKSYTTYAHHIKIHSSERNYKCDICSKRFNTSVQLCAHRKIHSRPFVCTVCNRAFASIVNWRSHMRLRHGNTNEAFNSVWINDKKDSVNGGKATCSICGAMYVRSISLRQHMRTRHGIEDISSTPLPVCDLNPHELDEMDLVGTHFLASREEIVIQQKNEHEEQHIAEECHIEMDEQSALLIAVANATELQQSH